MNEWQLNQSIHKMALKLKESSRNYYTKGSGFFLTQHISPSYSCGPSGTGSNEVPWATAPHAFVSSH